MSSVETPLQTGYPDEFSDAVANMAASILQEQLAPVVKTLREHAKLLDLHAALLNHSTAMNRYNVGKIDDIRDFQTNINYKLQFYIFPEDRWYPNERNPRTVLTPASTSTSSSTETLLNPTTDSESRLPPADVQTDDEPSTPGHSTTTTTAADASPGVPDRPPTPAAATEYADSRPTTPRQQQQQLGDVVVPSRRLQRERPFSVDPDPMWNSSRDIKLYERLSTTTTPYTEAVPSAGRPIESVEEVLRSDPEPFGPAETIEVELLSTTTLQPSTLYPLSSTTLTYPSEKAEKSTTTTTTTAAATTAPENEKSDHVLLGSGEEKNLNVESQLSEKARGKKRMREEDYSPSDDGKDDSEKTLENLHPREGCSSGTSTSGTSSDRDGQPERKRMKTDKDDKDKDTRISTDPLEVDEMVLMVARKGLFDMPTDAEGCRQVKKLKEIERLYRNRSGRLPA